MHKSVVEEKQATNDPQFFFVLSGGDLNKLRCGLNTSDFSQRGSERMRAVKPDERDIEQFERQGEATRRKLSIDFFLPANELGGECTLSSLSRGSSCWSSPSNSLQHRRDNCIYRMRMHVRQSRMRVTTQESLPQAWGHLFNSVE